MDPVRALNLCWRWSVIIETLNCVNWHKLAGQAIEQSAASKDTNCSFATYKGFIKVTLNKTTNLFTAMPFIPPNNLVLLVWAWHCYSFPILAYFLQHVHIHFLSKAVSFCLHIFFFVVGVCGGAVTLLHTLTLDCLSRPTMYYWCTDLLYPLPTKVNDVSLMTFGFTPSTLWAFHVWTVAVGLLETTKDKTFVRLCYQFSSQLCEWYL